MFCRLLRSTHPPARSLFPDALARQYSKLPSALSAPYPSRTHTCGSLSASDAGLKVILMGWILPERKMKTINKSFYHLKDSFGMTQLLVDHVHGDCWAELSQIPVESTVLIEGTVLLRPVEARKPGNTGTIDVNVEKVTLLNPADENLPFLPSNTHNLASFSGFTEVETPVLLRSSPEGAREFLVPARSLSTLNGVATSPVFYALSQSPQQPKQLLICSGGVDKYFQIAKCFRDEDGRKDRQPEFTQVDLEMAFVSWGKNQELNSAVNLTAGESLPATFDVMTYHEAMTRFGSDKPDTRFGLEIINISDFLSISYPSDFVLECIVVRKSSDPGFIKSSKALEPEGNTERIALTESTRATWLLGSRSASHVYPDLSPTDQTTVNKALNLKAGDDIWLSCRPRNPTGGSTALGRARLQIFDLAQNRGEFIVTKDPHFLWITEFPLFTRDDVDKDHLAHGRWSSSHHPFTAPMWQDIDALYRGEVEKVRGQHYDLVLNGVEIGGGSVRVHDAAMQEYIFTNVLGLTEEERLPFRQLVHALQCGAPPHGGIALGLDRIMAILCKTQSIRDVIAFPKTASGTDLLFKSPAGVKDQVLAEYGIQPKVNP
ncbi:tRNA synthetases class II-domain-containing protein [Gymnopilus junonius]|uniref:tRNA synthetases class II-domain-containing protein n=1 Tax=Gymnopilus junonius TaxID=109634 RepID=A0A9P5NQ24_GYMJU|nr:tRNA synthetases class II-domain-containing protein [Gymnopilus junonius]